MKKSIILAVFAMVMLFSFVALFTLSITIFKRMELCFYSFCLCVGIYEMAKGFLLANATSSFFGSTLFYVAISCTLCSFLPISDYVSVLVGTSFCLSSLQTYLIHRQNFHLVLCFATLFMTAYGYLLTKNLISFEIFIAFVVSFLLLLILTILSNIKWRK